MISMTQTIDALRHLDPLTTHYIEWLKWDRRIQKSGLSGDLPELKIAVLGAKNTQFFTKVLRMMGLREGFSMNIYEAEYNSIRYEIETPTSALYTFKPDVLILLPHTEEVTRRPFVLETEADIDAKVNEVTQTYLKYWKTVQEHHPCAILQANFVIPFEQPLDSLEVNVLYSSTSFFSAINLSLIKNKPSYVHLIDENGIASELGRQRWFDPVNAILNKAPYAYDWLPTVAYAYVRKIATLQGRIRKVLVLDLDNTLWGGVIADDGVEGIQLDPNDPLGEAFLSFQRYVLTLKARGVLLAVNSKNTESNAKLGFSHPNMLIKLEDIAVFVANFEDKATNCLSIAQALNVKPDALVFVDDNPFERQIVALNGKGVMVIPMPEDPALYVTTLQNAHAFDWAQITHEDHLRIQAQAKEAEREALMSSAVDYPSYLKSLAMVATAERIRDSQVERFTQLANKSNQFNLRTIRLSEADVLAHMENPDTALLAIDLSDQFSPYGVIACVTLLRQEKTAFIENWVMSCRVLNRTVEELTLNLMVETAKSWGCVTLIGEYLPTAKNGLVESLYARMGFESIGTQRFALNLSTFTPRTTYIQRRNLNEYL